MNPARSANESLCRWRPLFQAFTQGPYAARDVWGRHVGEKRGNKSIGTHTLGIGYYSFYAHPSLLLVALAASAPTPLVTPAITLIIPVVCYSASQPASSFFFTQPTSRHTFAVSFCPIILVSSCRLFWPQWVTAWDYRSLSSFHRSCF